MQFDFQFHDKGLKSDFLHYEKNGLSYIASQALAFSFELMKEK